MRSGARQNSRIARQPRRGNGSGILAPAHQAGHFVGFQQAVQAQLETKLVAVFPGAEISSGADREAAERPSAKLAGSPAHFLQLYGPRRLINTIIPEIIFPI